MIAIVEKIIDFYLKNNKEPDISDIFIDDQSLLAKQSNLFVTIYLNGEIRGSAGNIREIEKNTVLELIKNTISAINDERFTKNPLSDLKNLSVRIDEIVSKNMIKEGGLKNIDPVRFGVLVIKKDYTKLAVVLPNISGLIVIGQDFFSVFDKKLGERFNEKDYIVYSIETKVYTNY